MKIYRGKIKSIAEDVVEDLVRDGDIEVGVEQIPEVMLDIEAIIKEYLRVEEEINVKTRDLLESRNVPYTEFGKVRRLLAEEKNFELGDRGLMWICNQITESFMVNSRVDEVYADDYTLRIKIVAIFDKYLGLQEQVEKEARARIKNIEEGTAEWDVEYERVYKQIQRKKGLI